jgi:phosphoglycolate phosphatase-like HAD superfamily hydrolase
MDLGTEVPLIPCLSLDQIRGRWMFKGFVFDVEGTLVDSVPQTLRSMQDALERSGYRVPIQTLQLYSGLDADQTVQLAVPDASERERLAIASDQSEIYAREYLSSVKPFERVRDVLETLARQGGLIAIATDCKGPAFRRYRSLLDADEFIAVTACGDDVEHGKPDPRLVGTALRRLDLPASQAVVVGDTPYDAEAALDAGTQVAGVLTGGFSEKVLRQAGCFAVGRDLRALLPTLLVGEATDRQQSDWLRSA